MSDLRRKLVKLLKEGGCNYVRPAKGDHEWWYSPITGQHFSVDHSIKSFHTANGVLKQAGLPKAF